MKTTKGIGPYSKQFADSMRSLRGFCQLTQTELAERSGIGRQTIANIETRAQSVGLDQAFVIAEALGSTVEAMCRGLEVQ